jgi:hypothetical protein
MMNPDFRALCAELVAALDPKVVGKDGYGPIAALLPRARAALAQPVAPTDEELCKVLHQAICKFPPPTPNEKPMTDQSFPITPPPEMVEKWVAEIWHEGTPVRIAASDIHIATQAAQWGADQELEACIEEVQIMYGEDIGACIHDFRRPKPLSLKEQALEQPHATWGADQELEACCERVRSMFREYNRAYGQNPDGWASGFVDGQIDALRRVLKMENE